MTATTLGDLGSAAAFVLAAVFGWAALAKFRDMAATTAGFAGLGLRFPHLLARVVPLVELALAGTLVTVPPVAAVVALAVLAGFTGVLVRELVRGSTAGCNCFGSASAEPVSAHELVRNLLLAALAVVATGAPAPPTFDLASVVLVSTAVAIGAVGLGVARLRQRLGRVWDNSLAGEGRGR